jgi:hypothetical protein
MALSDLVNRLRAARPINLNFRHKQDIISSPKQTDRRWGPRGSYPMGTGASIPRNNAAGVLTFRHQASYI